jgi:hypothetical protein
MEALWSLQRDREQRHALLQAQLRERQTLQAQIREARNNHAQRLRDLHRDAANFRAASRAEPSKAPTPQERLDSLRTKAAPQFTPEAQQTQKSGAPLSTKDRLERLRQESKDKDRERPPGPDLDR